MQEAGGGSQVCIIKSILFNSYSTMCCRLAAEARACTGVRGIHEMARDIKIDNFSVTFYGANLLQDTKLELSTGNRYRIAHMIITFIHNT